METIDEILTAFKDKQSDNELLRQRMENDFDLFALKAFQPEFKGYEAYTSPAPRNFFDKVTDGLNRAQMTIQIKLAEDATEAQQRAASVGELYLFGALHAIDRRLRKRGRQPLREMMGFHIGCRGWYGLRLLVYVPKGETETVFDADPWDVMHMAWEEGEQGLLWAAYQYEATKAQIKAAYNLDIPDKTAAITDFWDTEVNGVIVGKQLWGKELKEHNIGHVPVLVGPVGSMPSIVRKDNSQSTIDLQGDSVWAASRGIYTPKNKYISWVMDKAKASVAGSLIHEYSGTFKPLVGDPYQSFQEIPLNVDNKETLKPLETPPMPPEMAAALAIIDKDEQQSTLPYPLAYGGTTEAMSGKALSQLDDNPLSAYSPRTSAMARVYTWLGEELLHQFAVKGMKATEMRGYDSKQEFFVVKVRPKDINPGWYVDVRVEPKLPRDRSEEISQALRATGKRGPEDEPLISKATAREEFLKLRDPDAEHDKVLAEMGEALPPIVAANVAAALKRRGKEELAEQVLVLLGGPGAVNGKQPLPAPGGPGGPGVPGGPGGGQVPPQLVDAVMKALITTGNEQLAEALFMVLTGENTGRATNGAGPVGPAGRSRAMPPVVAAWG